MSKLTYQQARADHEYLWSTYGPANDMSGGYVDQEDLWELLRYPTRTTARKAYYNQICYWFQVGPDTNHTAMPGTHGNSMSEPVTPDRYSDDPRVHEIAIRYGVWAKPEHTVVDATENPAGDDKWREFGAALAAARSRRKR